MHHHSGAACEHRCVMKSRFVLMVGLILALSACGFHLRGSRPMKLQATKIFMEVRGARQIAAEVKRQLEINEVPVVTRQKDAEAILSLSNEQFDRRVLSVDPRTGKWREFELSYEVDLAISKPDGEDLVKRDTLQISRDHSFDETAVVSKFEEEQQLREEMMRDAAETILRRLETIEAH